MNKRYTGNTMTLEHFHDFYYLEALMAGIAMAYSNHPDWQFKHSLNRLEADVKEAFAHLTHEMALRIYVYLYAASMGEARYAQDFNLPFYIKGLKGDSRQTVYNKALDYFPTPENVDVLKGVFSQNWGGSYGGKAWKNIVEAMELYGKVSDATFIDHSVDLEHNGGCVFSKGASFGLDCYSYYASSLKVFLDFKFKENILEKSCGDINISRKVYSLIDRFINITTTLGSGQYIRMIIALNSLHPTLEWLKDYTVDWDCKTLETVGTKPAPKVKSSKVHVKGKHVDTVVEGKKYLVKYDGRSHGCGWDASHMGKTDGRIIRIHHIGGGWSRKPFGYCKGWWYCRHWLYEVDDFTPVKKELLNGEITVTVKRNADEIPSLISFVPSMHRHLGKEITVKQHKAGVWMQVGGNNWYYDEKWLDFGEDCVIVKPDADKIDGGGITFLSGMQTFLGKKCKVLDKSKFTVLVGFEKSSFYMPYQWLYLPDGFEVPAEERRQERRHRRCPECGRRIDEWNTTHSKNTGKAYCDSCYERLFKTCDKCDAEIDTDCAVDAEHHHKYFWLCRDCAHDVMAKCDGCDEWFEDYIITSDTQDYFCEQCADGMYCRKCNNHYADKREHDKRHERRSE